MGFHTTEDAKALSAENTQAVPVSWLLRNFSAASWIRVGVIAVFLSLCLLTFITIELPIREGISDLRLGADSDTYYAFAKVFSEGTGASGGAALIGFSSNLLGPIAMALLLKSPFVIMLANLVLFFLAIQACGLPGVSRTKLAVLLALNITTLVSIVTLNKEIFALTSTLLLCRYVSVPKPSRLLLLAILLTGLLARWQQPVLVLLFLFFLRPRSFFRKRPAMAVAALISSITVIYPFVARLPIVQAFATYTGNSEQGTVHIANVLQTNFLFPIGVIPKMVQHIVYRTFSLSYWLVDYASESRTDLANRYVIHLHSLATTVIVAVAWLRGVLTLRRPLLLFCLLYLIVTSANLFIQPRYEYPIYVILCFELCRARKTSNPLLDRIWIFDWVSRPFSRWGLPKDEARRPSSASAHTVPSATSR